MGAWDMGPFENDGALDLLDELGGTADPAGALAGAMREILAQGDYVESPEMSGVVAAACLVGARLIGSEPAAVAAEWLEANPFEVDAGLRGLAVSTLDRATRPGDNELYELWEDADGIQAWLDKLTPYRRALA
ncbi:DUF4259 domain-containing protein [Streptosporangium carneum]|uniref:DUF4259 domain-containing protein n=1 Tax=Streptosporangium carneum TaxID=47481 RepID=A0A9W6I9B9_9ACTN|nr:DUF4259 domain-containing protein [Streptosporangium carneum]GLK13791.1 hypothetical protein GCM10017600_72020 [Streptosporangium carneum]